MKILHRFPNIIVMISILPGTIYCSDGISRDTMKSVLGKIEREITDLTASQILFYSATFNDEQKAMTYQKAEAIVSLIKTGDINDTQSLIGIYMISCGLQEKQYWDVMLPLVSLNIKYSILTDVLGPPFPYGPGYANAYNIEPYRSRLIELKAGARISLLISELNELITGRTSIRYREFMNNPNEYNYKYAKYKYLGPLK